MIEKLVGLIVLGLLFLVLVLFWPYSGMAFLAAFAVFAVFAFAYLLGYIIVGFFK